MKIEIKLINKGKTDVWMDMYDLDLARNMALVQDCAEIYVDDVLTEKYIRGRIIK